MSGRVQASDTFNPATDTAPETVLGEAGAMFMGCVVTPAAADAVLTIKDGAVLKETILVKSGETSFPFFPPPHKMTDALGLVVELTGVGATATVYYRLQ